MLILLTVAILPWHAVAETPSAPVSNTSQQKKESPRRGIVPLRSKLRGSPSTQSQIVTITKEGAHVEILAETGRWYRVRDEEGVEAWIYKPLVLIEHEPLNNPRAPSPALAEPDITEIPSASAARLDAPAESQPEIMPEQQGSGAPSTVRIDEPYDSPEVTGTGWFIDAILSHVQGLGAYVMIALAAVLVLSIALQLRASRQLRRAMQEMGQILDIVEEIYLDGALARTSGSGIAMNPMPAEASTYQPPRPVIEFSPIEHAVLEAMSDQHQVQEGELGKMLDEKGFAGVLIKAVIGDIVRKTGTAGVPWVEVRYVQGRYSYRLRPEARPNLSAPQADRP